MGGRRTLLASAGLAALAFVALPALAFAIPLVGQLSVERPIEVTGLVVAEDGPVSSYAIARWASPDLNSGPFMGAERAIVRLETWAHNVVSEDVMVRNPPTDRLPVQGLGQRPPFNVTHANLTVLSAGPVAQWRAWDSFMGKEAAAWEGTGALCAVWDPPDDTHHEFPDDANGPPNPHDVVWPGNVQALQASCDMSNLSVERPLVTSLYGMELELISDEGREVFQTGTFNETQEGVPTGRRITQILNLQYYLGSPIRFDFCCDLKVDLHAHAFRVAGSVAVGPSHGFLDLPDRHLEGDLAPFEATGAFRTAWAPDGHIGFEGQAVSSRGLAAVGEPRAGPMPALAVWTGAGALAIAAALAWAAYARLHPERVLAHPRRQFVLDFVRREPGAGIHDLSRALGIAWPLTAHHVTALARVGALHVVRIGGRVAVFPAKAGYAPVATAVALLRRSTHRSLYELLQDRPGQAQSALAAQVGVSQPRVSQALAQMRQAGLVSTRKSGRHHLYYPLVVPTPSPPAGLP